MARCFYHLRNTYSGVRKDHDGKPGYLWTARCCGEVIARCWLPLYTTKYDIVETLTAYTAIARQKAGGKPVYVPLP